MDKNKIKSFAIWARRSLIAQVSEKANRIGIYEDKIEEAIAIQGGFKLEGKDEIFSLSNSHRDALKNQVKEKGFEQVMEEVAYTWFNRFMGLRYMEVNDYLPSGVRILSSEVEDKKEPDVLTKVSEIIDELGLNANEIYDLLDTGNTIDREKAYRIILVKQCNELGKIIPQMFEKISDYTELLLPDNLLEEGSVIRKMVEDIEESDWKEEVEIIGWMYQYYISEKKDEVFAALKKNVKITKENIPAATQLFTPKWIVKYMVENSLGRLWLEGHPNEELQKEWKYYLEEAQQEPEVEEELKKIREEHSLLSPEDIKVLDPCMGSGHILVYAFDVLYEIYKSAGYSEREIPRMILQNNLYGLDIDDRAAQLASFALIMKARHYNRRLFREIEREHLDLNLCSIQESNEITDEAIDYFANGNEELKNDVKYLVDVFTDAKEYGSILEVEKVDFEALKQRLREIEEDDNLMFGDFRNILLDRAPVLIKQGEIMSNKYEVCVTNPPYMGSSGMNIKLTKYVSTYYKETKSDMFSVFIKKGFDYCSNIGFNSMITMQAWMFLSSFEELRRNIINKNTIIQFLQIGYNSFPELNSKIAQGCAFILLKEHVNLYKSSFINLNDAPQSSDKKQVFLCKKKSNEYFVKSSNDFLSVPGAPIAYWVTQRFVENFNIGIGIDNISDFTGSQNKTANNEKYLRYIWEVENSKVGKCNKWVFYAKGGDYRKYYGNLDLVVDWSVSARNFYKENKTSNILNEKYWFREGITYTMLSTKGTSFRYYPSCGVFDMGGPTICYLTNLEYVLGLLNSIVTRMYLNVMNPTINLQAKDIKSLPIIINEIYKIKIESLVNENIIFSKSDWNNFEKSWDFKVHPLLKLLDKGEQYKIGSVFNIWETECEENFNQLKSNEEELNRIFIDIYGLQDELTPEVEDKDITIRKADRERDIKSLISYAVGCLFGRYSIDSEGLIYAGGDFSDKWALNGEQCKVKSYIDMPENDLGTIREYKSDANGNLIDEEHEIKEESQRKEIWIDASFAPDKDNIIPITEDEYFEDDIVSRFIEFIRTVYGEENIEENLDYIADSIGRKTSESARQAIRRYFIKDFYKDHLKVYQKRPIYWMFESGKNDGFKCLVYMHRYNEQTVARVRTDYLHTLQRKYESEINRLQLVVDSEEYTAKDRTAAKKKIARISKQLEECREYDQVVAHFANEKISIDLDDGVKINYAKFQGVTVINSKEKEVKMNLLTKI
ncbi:BREX-1 system adenine-specific DNA-methyltransferase PglX [Clostridium sp. ZS1]|uniref:BREX-1 system adenine-specific DNA-methyltransferase PglX n=1 Tax=Clostridium sp. ZS1 TaxID=2949989 RepID=UPI00207A87CA|nr:BREX-1 system adenine-specific DNA-methyltransferase PglX [Clostridium sp. ZS1]